MKVLLCGDGNAMHVLAACASSSPDTHVTILSLSVGEADELRDAIPNEGIRCVDDIGNVVAVGRPNLVVDRVSCYTVVNVL